ncbi:hypothetical protein JFL47_00770 [Haemophilus haemoglobinophilus]|nr:hypothetical protein [Canicola haemoglobinophilus]
MNSTNSDFLDKKYFTGKSLYHSELLKQIILELEQNRLDTRMKSYYLSFLKLNNFNALHDLLDSKINYNQFRKNASLETRTDKTLIIPSVFEHPDYQRKHKENKRKALNTDVRKYFEVGYIDSSKFTKLMPILIRLYNKKRINEEQKVFLLIEKDEFGNSYFDYEKIYTQYHLIEGDYYLKEFQKHKDIWKLINASSHFRKANQSEKVKKYLENIDKKLLSSLKIESAYLTTYSAVNRDLGNFSRALDLANTAHIKQETDYRPCTLLGAIYFDLQNIEKGHEWFKKAQNLGADNNVLLAEIKNLYLKSSNEYKFKLEAHFKYENQEIFDWIILQKKKRQLKD